MVCQLPTKALSAHNTSAANTPAIINPTPPSLRPAPDFGADVLLDCAGAELEGGGADDEGGAAELDDPSEVEPETVEVVMVEAVELVVVVIWATPEDSVPEGCADEVSVVVD